MARRVRVSGTARLRSRKGVVPSAAADELGRGAASDAPTAPHASDSPSPPPKRNGPARFWDPRRATFVLRLALALSLVAHLSMSPWRLLPDRNALKLEDAPGELTIPVDLLGEEPPPPPPPPSPPESPPDPTPVATATKPPPRRDAGPKPLADAGDDADSLDASTASTDLDAGVADGAADADTDASGAIAQADASTGPGGGPRDPGSMIGMSSLVTAGPVSVTLLVNIGVIRGTPIGARIGPLLSGIPRWKDILQAAGGTIDPLRDGEWLLIYGPSLINTSRDAILVRYSASDAVVEKAVATAASKYDQGGVFDAGVPGVNAWLAHADGAERVIMRVQPHVLTVVPKANAPEFARVLKRAPVAPKVRPGEALRLVLKDPANQIKIRGVKIEGTITELRLWVVPRASDGGADVFVEGDCASETDATAAADALNDMISKQNTIVVRALTRGLLNGARVTADGTHVNLRLSASRDQIESIVQAIGASIGVEVTPGAAPPP